MSLPKLLECGALKEAMTKFNYKSGDLSKLKILDCTYAPTPPLTYEAFKKDWFAKFNKLNERMSKHKLIYLKEHIPGAIFLDLDAAFYPGQNNRFSTYEPHVFESYAQLLGLNNDDHLVFYSRGQSMSAMLFAARMYWLFKSYGHRNLSVLNGGINCWKEEHNFDVESLEEVIKLPAGNWTSLNRCAEFNIHFSELETGFFDQLSQVNFLDTRTQPQYEGVIETGLDPYAVEGSNVPGTKNVPAIEMVQSNGKLKSEAEIKEILLQANFVFDKPTYCMCMVGMQASLLAFTLDSLSISSKLYGGSLYEISRLDPKRISGGFLNTRLNVNSNSKVFK